MIRKNRTLSIAAVLLFCLSCATPLPSSREEARIGAQAAEEVQREIGLVRDPALVGYVGQVGQRVADAIIDPTFAYRFYVADMSEPNAFALPGGHVYVSRGLLALANSEAELANVLGHEIGHVKARHGVERQSRATGVGILSVLGTVAAAAVGGGEAARAVAQLGQVAGAGYIASYSRDQEREADEIGQSLAARSGFDPEGMPTFLRSLESETFLRTGEARKQGFLDSHPVTAERIQATQTRARNLSVTSPRPVAGDRAAFLGKLEGLTVGPDPAHGLFRGPRFLHPALDFTFSIPSGWRSFNQADAAGAVSPDGSAVTAIQMQAPARTAAEAAEAFARANRIQLEGGQRLTIGGYDAYHARTTARSGQTIVGLDFFWIARPDATFRWMGAAPVASFESRAREFGATARSFRSLTSEERASIRSRHLAVVRARQGEGLAALSSRSGNVWSVEETAVANALEPAQPLAAGYPVKIAVERPVAR